MCFAPVALLNLLGRKQAIRSQFFVAFSFRIKILPCCSVALDLDWAHNLIESSSQAGMYGFNIKFDAYYSKKSQAAMDVQECFCAHCTRTL